ncbi:MAG TPA: hypothetical protein DIT95_05335, partial [Arenibacter sp.]|nr:hypothetical protein [Arenibacter sp.]
MAVQILNRIETYFYILNINQLKSIKMKSKYFNIRIFLILLLTGMFGSFHLAYSQSQNKGLIRGTVKDLDSQNPLPGANIRIVGT